MIPSAAMNSGTARVEAIEPNARRVGGPEHGQDEDQPDVVGLPHRPHRAVGVRADPLGARAASREQLPESGSEVGPGEYGVEGEPGEHER